MDYVAVLSRWIHYIVRTVRLDAYYPGLVSIAMSDKFEGL